MIDDLFAAIDRADASTFATFLTDDCVFRFGNQPPVVGSAAAEAFVAGFFNSIGGLAHRLEDSWPVAGGHVCHGEVTYTRLDGSTLSVPFCNVFRLRDGLIAEYLIFADTSLLYASPQE